MSINKIKYLGVGWSRKMISLDQSRKLMEMMLVYAEHLQVKNMLYHIYFIVMKNNLISDQTTNSD